MIQLLFTLKTTTKTCYRFENNDGGEQTTLYLKKHQVDGAGIDPEKGILVSVEEAPDAD